MEIEVVTTKKKLSLSLINQMPFATHEDLAMVMLYPDRVIGYVMVKNEKFALLKGNDDWKKVSIQHAWVIAKHTPLECIDGNRFIRFPDEETRDLFMARYAKLRELATVHIYI